MTELQYTKKYDITNLTIISILLVALACFVVYTKTAISSSLLISVFIAITLAIFVAAGYIAIIELTIQVKDNTITITKHKSKKEIIIPFSEITSFQAIETKAPDANSIFKVATKKMTILWKNNKFTMKEVMAVPSEIKLLQEYTNFASMLYNTLNDYKEKNGLTFRTQFEQGYVEDVEKEETIESLKEQNSKNTSFMGATWFFVTISIVMLFALYFIVDSFFISKKSLEGGDWVHISLGLGAWSTSFSAWSVRRKLKKRLKDTTS
jgi:hypothetical protein